MSHLTDFCLLRKPPPKLPLFLMGNIKMDAIPTKINEKYTPFSHCILSFEGYFLWKFVPDIQRLDILLLLFYISFYISRHYFSQIFRNSFNIIWKKKKIFVINFPFITNSVKPPPPQPLNSQNEVRGTVFT